MTRVNVDWLVLVYAACGSDDGPSRGDGDDAGADAAPAETDAGTDATSDAIADAGHDFETLAGADIDTVETEWRAWVGGIEY